MQLKEFKIRCSAIWEIMGRVGLTENQQKELSELSKREVDSSFGKAKPLTEKMKEKLRDLQNKKMNPDLPETCKSYLQDWLKDQIYNTQKAVKSKYLTKGIQVENLAIDYYAEEKGLGFVLKNEEEFSNNFMTGTPDLILPDLVVDLKSSWDCFTFPLFETEIDKSYWMQIQGYLHLTGRKQGKLVYTLQNTPDELEWDETVDYSGISSEFRIKEFEIEYDPEFISSVEDRVVECREYIKELTSTWK